jgi:pilus assembly protein Flp/PilA
MESTANQMRIFLDNESGVTSIEYALLAALIAMVIVGAVGTTGITLAALYTMVADEVKAAFTAP